MNGRILHLAIAEGRGHLMRAHLLRRALGQAGVEVKLVTTSIAGQAFLGRLGDPSTVLPGGYGLALDSFHNLDVAATRARTLRYLATAAVARDLRHLERLARDADLVVNDSLHPALLHAAAWKRELRVVQLVGENILLSTQEALERERSPLGRMFRALFLRSFDRAFGRILHTLEAPSCDEQSRTWRLAPLAARPTRSRDEVREALGCGQCPLLVAYLNPHYAAAELARSIETVASERGFHLYAVSEAFAARPQWRAADPNLVDAIAAADVFLSGAGMAAIAQSRSFGVPLVSVLGTQPEQRANFEQFRGQGAPCFAVSSSSPRFAFELDLAIAQARTSAREAASPCNATEEAWVRPFKDLIHAARTEQSHAESANSVTGDRNRKPQGRRRGAR